jgi:hypothetical protein
MAGITRIPRSRGAVSGLLLILLGAWGGLIPFVGPYFHYAYTPDKAWSYTTGRLWLEILPGAAALLGGLVVLASARRPLAITGAFLAALGGAWFVVGNLVSTFWNGSTPQAGVPAGGTITRLALEELGFFGGLGVVIVFFAALALGRCAVVGVKDAALAAQADGTAANAGLAVGGLAAEPEPESQPEAGIQPQPGPQPGPEPGPWPGAWSPEPPAPSTPPPGNPYPPRQQAVEPRQQAVQPASVTSPGGQLPPAATSQFPPAGSQPYTEDSDPLTHDAGPFPPTISQFPPTPPGGQDRPS